MFLGLSNWQNCMVHKVRPYGPGVVPLRMMLGIVLENQFIEYSVIY
jgi:hypothetical protein